MTSISTQIEEAAKTLENVAILTPLQLNLGLSEEYAASIFLKREDLQIIRSYKLRGAYNKIANLGVEDHKKGVVCASAGNHSQGVAYACALLGIDATIVMPTTTPSQKVKKARLYGKDRVEILLHGDSFDDAYHKAMSIAEEEGKPFIHPFDDALVIAGQGTVGLEILNQTSQAIDYLFIPIGGGGLAAGICQVFKQFSPQTKIIGVEPLGAPSMTEALKEGKPVALQTINTFVDGASVKKVGTLTYSIAAPLLHDVLLVPEGLVCSTLLKLYNEEAIVAEPAGALSVAALGLYADKIKGKNVVCVISGGNNDITRMEEIKERSLLYSGLKHYFIIRFPQRPGALKEFVTHVLSETMDISYFQYIKKNNKEQGPTVVGIELQEASDFMLLMNRLKEHQINYRYLNEDSDLYTYLIGY